MRAYLDRIRTGGRSGPPRLPPLSVSITSSPQFYHFDSDINGDNDGNNSDETFSTKVSDSSQNRNFKSNIHHKSRNQIDHNKNHDKKILESSQRVLKEFSPNIIEFSGDTFSSSNYNPNQISKKNALNHKLTVSKTNNNSPMEITKMYEKPYLSNRPLYMDYHGNSGSDGEVTSGRKEYGNGKTREERKYFGKANNTENSYSSPYPSPGTVYSMLIMYCFIIKWLCSSHFSSHIYILLCCCVFDKKKNSSFSFY
jgi:hypothetical protein